MNAPDDSRIDIHEYLAVARTRKWTILLSIVVITGAAVALSLAQTPMYTAEARVLVEPVAAETMAPTWANPVDIQTQVEVIASEAVAALVVDELALEDSLDSILDNLSATPQGETQVVLISYTSPDAREAQVVAQAFAENYLAFRRGQAVRDVEAEEEQVTLQIEAATARLSDVTQEIAAAEAAGDDALATSLETQRNVLIARLGVLQQQVDAARAQRAQTSTSGQIIEPATLPETPSSPDHVRNAIVGLFLGFVGGIGLALLRERLDDRFRTRGDLEQALDAPVLATVPRYPGASKGQSPIVSVSQASIGAVEAYRSLRTNLQFITAQRNLRSVLITSPSEGEGKSSTTANLGVLLAQAGRRVVLISSDLRRPMLGRYFGVLEGAEDEPGLSSWLASGAGEPTGIIKDPGIPNLRIVPSGPIPPNPAELLTSPRTAELIQMLEASADIVLCDSPPVLAVADATELASVLGGTLLVVNAQSTSKSAAAHARQELQRVGGQLIGAVLNGFDPSTSPYYFSTYTAYHSAAVTADGNGAEAPSKGRRFRSRR